MRFIWDEAKRRTNLRDHEIDFIDAERVFAGLTATFEDDRVSYDERRFVTLGLLDGVPVSIVHTESDEEIRVISFRRATTHEEEILFARGCIPTHSTHCVKATESSSLAAASTAWPRSAKPSIPTSRSLRRTRQTRRSV